MQNRARISRARPFTGSSVERRMCSALPGATMAISTPLVARSAAAHARNHALCWCVLDVGNLLPKRSVHRFSDACGARVLGRRRLGAHTLALTILSHVHTRTGNRLYYG